MFVHDRTGSKLTCRRADLPAPEGEPPRRFAVLMSCEAYDARSGAHAAGAEAPPALAPALGAPVWEGTAVSVAGEVLPPGRGALARRVTLRVGSVERTLVGRGTRRWVRTRDGSLAPSAPEAWEPLDMSWAEALGGTEPVPAQRDAATGLPSPAYVAHHPQNFDGKGFVFREADAVGRELPRLELLEDQQASPAQPALPGCFAPCTPRQPGMGVVPTSHPSSLGALKTELVVPYTAPGYLVFPWLAPGTRVATSGMTSDVVAEVAGPRIELRSRRPESGAQYGVRLRAVHVDTHRGITFLVWQHTVLAAGRGLPDLEVFRRAEGAR